MHFIVYNSNFEKTYGRFATIEKAREHREKLLSSGGYMEKHPEWVVIYRAEAVE